MNLVKNAKITLIPASLFRHSRIEAYLEKKAEEGWLLEAATGLFFRFRRMEPKKLRYEVVNFPEGVTERNLDEAYAQRRREAAEEKGWKLAARQGGFLIFYSEQAHPEPIVADAVQAYQDTSRQLAFACKQSWLWLAVSLINLIAPGIRFSRSHLDFFSDTVGMLATAFYLLIILVSVGRLVAVYCWRRKARRAAEQKKDVPEYASNKLLPWSGAVLGLVLALVAIGHMGYSENSIIIVASIAFVVLTVVLVNIIPILLLQTKVSEKMRKGLNVAVILVAVAGFVTFSACTYGKLPEDRFTRSLEYTYHTGAEQTENSRLDVLPLVMPDFYGEDPAQYSRRVVKSGSSPLLSYLRATEWYRGEETRPSLEYEMYTVRLSCLYDDCLDEYRGIPKTPGDPAPWGAKEVYVRQVSDEYNNFVTYLVLWEDKILFATWGNAEPLTNEQIQIIAEKLNPSAR